MGGSFSDFFLSKMYMQCTYTTLSVWRKFQGFTINSFQVIAQNEIDFIKNRCSVYFPVLS